MGDISSERLLYVLEGSLWVGGLSVYRLVGRIGIRAGFWLRSVGGDGVVGLGSDRISLVGKDWRWR